MQTHEIIAESMPANNFLGKANNYSQVAAKFAQKLDAKKNMGVALSQLCTILVHNWLIAPMRCRPPRKRHDGAIERVARMTL
jgi:hypothetical protein